METKESLKELAILEQYKMGKEESNSVKAWTKVYEADEWLDAYLEKSGYPTAVHEEFKDQNILEQYTMGAGESNSVKAWTVVYDTDELLDAYLEKSGYICGNSEEDKTAA